MSRVHVSFDRYYIQQAHIGGALAMTDYIGAVVLFVFIVAVLVLLWRREHR